MIHNINGKKFKEQPNDLCPGCCFFDHYGCLMPVDIACVLGSICAEKGIIYKDITDAEGSNKKVG